MTNYIVVDKASNLCVNAITTSHKLKPSDKYSFVRVNDKALAYYYSHTDKNTTLLDIGHLMAVSSYVRDQVTCNRSGNAEPMKLKAQSKLNLSHVTSSQSHVTSCQ